MSNDTRYCGVCIWGDPDTYIYWGTSVHYKSVEFHRRFMEQTRRPGSVSFVVCRGHQHLPSINSRALRLLHSKGMRVSKRNYRQACRGAV